MSLQYEFYTDMLKELDAEEEELKELIRVGRKFSITNCDIQEMTNEFEHRLAKVGADRKHYIQFRDDEEKRIEQNKGTKDADGDWLSRRDCEGASSGRIDRDRRENQPGENNDGVSGSVDDGVEKKYDSHCVFVGDGSVVTDGEDILF